MKKIVYKYQVSKFRRFANGLVFAIITCIALALCISHIYSQSMNKYELILPFSVAILSMLTGFYTMFHDNGNFNKKLQMNKASL